MSDASFGPILEELARIHEKYPDMRFGRVLQEAVDRYKRLDNVNFFDISSKQLLKALQTFNSEEEVKRVNAHGRRL